MIILFYFINFWHDVLCIEMCIYTTFVRFEMPLRMRVAACAHVHERTHATLKYFASSVTIAVGGNGIDVTLLLNLRRFIEEHCIAGLCVVKRGGALSHKHF